MRKTIFLLLLLGTLCARAQSSTDPELTARLQEYLRSNQNLDFENVMAYTHPRLFIVAPKEAIVQSMEQAFNGPEMKFHFDSMSVVSVGPVYQYTTAAYRKILYYMGLTIRFSDSTDLSDKALAAAMMQEFQKGFPGKKITVDGRTNTIRVSGTEVMFAIRDDQASKWMFLGYDKSKPELVRALYPKQVRQHFKLQ